MLCVVSNLLLRETIISQHRICSYKAFNKRGWPLGIVHYFDFGYNIGNIGDEINMVSLTIGNFFKCLV